VAHPILFVIEFMVGLETADPMFLPNEPIFLFTQKSMGSVTIPLFWVANPNLHLHPADGD